MKRLVLVSVLTVCMAGAAQGDFYTDEIDWSPDILLSHPGLAKTYTHSILDYDFPHVGETVTAATLVVWLYDDGENQKEQFKLTYDGTTWTSNHEDMPDILTAYPVTISPSVLSDGKLDVEVKADNGDFYLDKSVLTVSTTSVAPLPGAALLGVLGLVVAGSKLRRHQHP